MERLDQILAIDKYPNRRRVGRGNGSGKGSTSGRGTKGQKARTGKKLSAKFEGGQMPLVQRIKKKRGFKSHRKFVILKVNLQDLPRVAENNTFKVDELITAGKLETGVKVKLLGEGAVDQAYTLKVHLASKSAIEKIKQAGGSVELI